MRRIQKLAAVNVIAALIGGGIPAIAAQNRYDIPDHGKVQYQWTANRNQDGRNDRDHRAYDRRSDEPAFWGDHRTGRDYAPSPVYNVHYDDRSHNSRTAAIIGGSAAAGALIGAAAGHGQGAVIGAVVGGIAGVAANSAVNHHDRY